MMDGEPDGFEMYLWRDPSKDLLLKVIHCKNQTAETAAKELVNRLVAKGRFDYRALLPQVE